MLYLSLTHTYRTLSPSLWLLFIWLAPFLLLSLSHIIFKAAAAALFFSSNTELHTLATTTNLLRKGFLGLDTRLRVVGLVRTLK